MASPNLVDVEHNHSGTCIRRAEPNAGLVRYEPGASHPLHTHRFAQVWCILEGTFRIGSEGPICDGRFNVDERPDLATEDLDT